MAPLTVNILYNRTNTFGLTDDVTVIERLLKKAQDSIGQPIQKAKIVDIREPLSHCDIQFHLETPIFGAIPWGHTNVILINPEQWSYSYDSYVHAFDALLFRDPDSAAAFRADFEKKGIRSDHIHVIPWCASWNSDIPACSGYDGFYNGFVCFLAGSSSKYEYLKKLLPHWRPSDPPLTIYTTRPDFVDELQQLGLSDNVRAICKDMDVIPRYRIMSSYKGHLICSQGEAYGYAAANAEVLGAFTIMNSLPVFQHTYQYNHGIAWLSNSYIPSEQVRYMLASPGDTIRQELEEAFRLFNINDYGQIRRVRQMKAKERFSSTILAFLPIIGRLQLLIQQRQPAKGAIYCPPILHAADCPPITIITPTYQRKNLIDIAFHNLLATDYPREKIEWIVIEDNEHASQMASEKIVQFQVQAPTIQLKYIPIEGRMSIGEKRNIAIQHATNDIILFMDDDDHYPVTSFRRRVAWLTKGTKCGEMGKASIVCCTTLALYDLMKGTSAVNVPPFDIPFAQRISEATLTFRKSAWLERSFPHVSIAEGENWLEGRENQVIEIPPQQIIVAFSHGTNQSSRRIPPSNIAPSCFWGFPKEYLMFIHGLAGIQVEETTSSAKLSSE
jgi:hypothetical protein